MIRHIFVAPARGAPMAAVEEVEALSDCGLRGDRYLDPVNRKSADYQLTLIELENIEAFVRESGLPLAAHEPRRNLVTVGTNLNELCGKHFSVGEVELEGLVLCEPCGAFANKTHPQVLPFFVHKGGLRARIIKGGFIRLGDTVRQAVTTFSTGTACCTPTLLTVDLRTYFMNTIKIQSPRNPMLQPGTACCAPTLLPLLALFTLMLFIIGCTEQNADPATTTEVSSSSTRTEHATDKWLGQWNGPEGTFLKIAGGNGTYEITIRNLDGPRIYKGNGIDGQIRFYRGGVEEWLHATNGTDTGMKWLTDKSNCLTVRPGEGYCRD